MFNIIRYFTAICLICYSQLLFALGHDTQQAEATPLYVVTTIKPLYSIASSIAHGVLDIHLLDETGNFSHHMQMKPSMHKKLHQANILFWIGPELENYLIPALANAKHLKYKEPLINNPDLMILSEKIKPVYQNEYSANRTIKIVDPHIWLNPLNAIMIAEQMKHVFILMDPTHEAIYEQNYEAFVRRIEMLDHNIEVKLNNLHDAFFVVYHDAYSYFTTRYNLSNLGSLAGANDETIRASQLKKLHKLLKHQHIKCLFYTPHAKHSYIKKFNHQYPELKTVQLDPIGIYIENSANSYEILLDTLADRFSQCLQE